MTVAQAVLACSRYKGRPWSQTDYACALAQHIKQLLNHGATIREVAEFRRQMEAVPCTGFNQWSGD